MSADGMKCSLCRSRPGWSGYARMSADGIEQMPCRCVTDAKDAALYGNRRNRLLMLRQIRALAA